MDYAICIFLLGLIITFVVIVGLARAAEFAKSESAGRLELDAIPKDWISRRPTQNEVSQNKGDAPPLPRAKRLIRSRQCGMGENVRASRQCHR